MAHNKKQKARRLKDVYYGLKRHFNVIKTLRTRDLRAGFQKSVWTPRYHALALGLMKAEKAMMLQPTYSLA